MAKRNLYLNNTPIEEALEKYLAALGDLPRTAETVPVPESLGRVTSEAVYAIYNSPLYHAAAMDGIAVNAASTASAGEATPLQLKRDVDFKVVDTGDPIRDPYDAVIMAEDVLETGEDTVTILAPAVAWQHVRPIGEDIVAGEMILTGNHPLRPIDLGALLAGGITEVKVWKKPTVAIFPTGTEIIEPGTAPKEGDIIESNSRMFEAMVTEYGGIAHRNAPLPDDYNLLRDSINAAIDTHDMVIVNAGSSAGTEDFTVHILRELGEVIIHGVAIKPGKPVILAVVRGKPVIGLPGYPVSAYLDFETFVRPVLSRMTALTAAAAETYSATLSRRLVSSLKHREYVRIKAGRVRGKLVASPLARGAGAAMSLVRSDGFCVIEQNSEGVEAGEEVQVTLTRPMEEINGTAVAVGSHDLIMDLIADLMPGQFPGCYLSSSHVGSMGGLMALRRGEAHLTPTHLLDEETGIYNIATLRKMFPNTPMALIKGVERIQGLMIAPGNPLNIKGLEDLPRLRYINRQRGAGTRVLLDYRMKQLGITPEMVNGYDREAATHMAVAVAVQSGSADTGLGVSSAARAMGLDFLPIGAEEYDFAIPQEFLELPQIKAFLGVLASDAFRRELERLGGYGTPRTGEIILL